MSDQPLHGHRADRSVQATPRRAKLDPLHPARDTQRFDAAIRAIVTDAMAEPLVYRVYEVDRATGTRGVLASLASWSLPALAAVAAVVIAAAATLLIQPAPSAAAAPPTSLAESAGVAAPLVDWATEGRSPSVAALVAAFDGSDAPTSTAPVRRNP